MNKVLMGYTQRTHIRLLGRASFGHQTNKSVSHYVNCLYYTRDLNGKEDSIYAKPPTLVRAIGT